MDGAPAEVTVGDGTVLRYGCALDALPAALASSFVQLDHDEAAQHFVREALDAPHGALATAAYGLLRRVLSDYDAYGLLGMYPMHLLSTGQARTLLGERARGSLLDVGAGDGGVTHQLAPLFERVSATEQSKALARRLAARGYTVVDHDLQRQPMPGGARHDVVSCLNVIDRCLRPRSLLSHLAMAVTDGGRLLLSVPLPLRPHVHVGRHTADPDEPLPDTDGSFESAVATVASGLLAPAGLAVERWARLPYLCRGDTRTPLHVLDALVAVCRNRIDTDTAPWQPDW